MKLLLYCTKQPPYLVYDDFSGDCNDMCVGGLMFATRYKDELWNPEEDIAKSYNGKIVAECDFKVEEIKQSIATIDKYGLSNVYETKNMSYNQLLNKSCLSKFEILNYLKDNNGYAINIKNLHIFDEPKELTNYMNYSSVGKIKKAPQNMMQVCDDDEKKVLISIRPEWLCKILNGEKTIEVRKKVLKEMLKND